MAAINPQDLNNAKLDVDHMAALATSAAPTAVDRFGQSKKTWSGIAADLGADYAVTATGSARIAAELAQVGAQNAQASAAAVGNLRPSIAIALADATIAVGAGFVAPLADGSLQAYRKDSTSASSTVGLPFAASANVRAGVYAQQAAAAAISLKETVGRAVDPITGGASAAATYVMAQAAAADGDLTALRIFGLATGQLLLKIYNKVGSTFTQEGPDYPVAVVPGLQTLTAKNFGLIQRKAGQLVGFYTAAPLVVPNVSAAADSGGWYSTPGNSTGFTSTTLITNTRLQIGFDWQSVRPIGAQVDTLAASTEILVPDARNLNTAVGSAKSEFIGRPVTPVTGSAAGASTYIFASPASNDSLLKRIQLFTTGVGTLYVRRFTRAGSVFTQVGADEIFAVAAGLQTLTLPTPRRVLKGEYLGFYIGAVLAAPNGVADSGGWYFQAGNLTTVTSATAATGVQLQLGFELEFADLVNVVAMAGTLRAQGLARFPLILNAQRLHMLGYGQSNDLGANQAAITTTPSLYHLTFGVGPKMTKPGLSGTTNPDDGLTKALAEDNAAPSSSTFGETVCSTFAREISKRLASRGTPPIWFCSVAGKSGGPLVDIIPTGTFYANLIYHVTAAKAAADAAGKTYAVPVILFDHGETDQQTNTSLALCLSRLTSLFDSAVRDIQAITGQPVGPQFLFTTACNYLTTSSNHTQALLALAETRNDFHFVVPGYRFAQGGDGIHLTAWSQAVKGAYYARAASQLASGRLPDRIRWLGAVADGATLTMTASAPTALQFSASVRPQATDNGIKVQDDTGALMLSGMAMGAAKLNPQTGLYETAITMTLNRALGVNPIARYGLDYLGTGMLITGGASGNVFDTSPDTFTIGGTTYSLAHPAPPATVPIWVQE